MQQCVPVSASRPLGSQKTGSIKKLTQTKAYCPFCVFSHSWIKVAFKKAASLLPQVSRLLSRAKLHSFSNKHMKITRRCRSTTISAGNYQTGAPCLARLPRPGPCLYFGFQYALIRINRSKKIGVKYWALPGSNSPWRPYQINECYQSHIHIYNSALCPLRRDC